MKEVFTVALTLFLVTDALGTLPLYLHMVEELAPKRQVLIALREWCFAFIFMVIFYFLGHSLLMILDITHSSLDISGGIMLFLIAIKMIFTEPEPTKVWRKKVPFVVPIAVPLLVGPSFFAVITVFAESAYSHRTIFTALVAAWVISTLIYLFGRPIFKGLKETGLLACQRLMGLLIALISVQMLLKGLKEVFL